MQSRPTSALAGAVVGALIAVATWTAAAAENCGTASPETAEGSGSAGSPETSTDALRYWTPERMRSAKPAGYELDC